MKNKIILLIVFLCFANLCFAQSASKADSLVSAANVAKTDSAKVKLLNDAVWEFMYLDKAKAISTGEKSLAIALKINNPRSLSDCYNTLGCFYMIASDFTKSIEYHEKALGIRLKLNDKKGLMGTYNNLGAIKKEVGNYKEEINLYFKALHLAEELKDTVVITKIYNNIADAFARQTQFGEAAKYHLLALAIRKKQHDTQGMISSYIGLGVGYTQQENYQLAKLYYDTAATLLTNKTDNYTLAKYHANYAALLKDIGRKPEAIEHIKKSIELNEAIGNVNGNLVSYANLGAIYEELNKVDEAKEVYLKTLQISKEVNNIQWQKQAYLGLATTSYARGEYQASCDNYFEYTTIKDSLQSIEIASNMNELNTKYETEKKENEIKLLKQNAQIKNLEIAQQKLQIQKRNYTLLGGLLLLIVLASGAYFWFGKQQLKNKLAKEITIRETEEGERARIAKDIHDDLGSGLSKINFLSELVFKQAEHHAELKHNVESISETAKKMVDNMRDLVWALNPDNTTLANLIARVREYSSDYLEDFPIELKSSYPENIPQLPITKESHRGIFMVAKESLNNIVKHSHATEVEIIAQLTNQNLSITIEDNGVGFDIKNYQAGNGLHNMKSRIVAAGGSFEINSNLKKGTRITISIPLAKVLKS